MNWNTRFIPVLLATGLSLANSAASSAQHQDGGPGNRARIRINLFSPLGQPVTQDYNRYRFVVPPTRSSGTFYTYENRRYYTPPARRGAGQAAAVPRPEAVEFGAAKHNERLAERLDLLANDLCLDLHHNYRHNPGFNEAYGEAYQLLQGAKRIHSREHQGDREAMRRSITTIDNLFHHLQGELSEWTPMEQRRVGQADLHGKLNELEAVIHHLMFDLGVKPEHDADHGENEDAPPPTREEAPPPRQ